MVPLDPLPLFVLGRLEAARELGAGMSGRGAHLYSSSEQTIVGRLPFLSLTLLELASSVVFARLWLFLLRPRMS